MATIPPLRQIAARRLYIGARESLENKLAVRTSSGWLEYGFKALAMWKTPTNNVWEQNCSIVGYTGKHEDIRWKFEWHTRPENLQAWLQHPSRRFTYQKPRYHNNMTWPTWTVDGTSIFDFTVTVHSNKVRVSNRAGRRVWMEFWLPDPNVPHDWLGNFSSFQDESANFVIHEYFLQNVLQDPVLEPLYTELVPMDWQSY